MLYSLDKKVIQILAFKEKRLILTLGSVKNILMSVRVDFSAPPLDILGRTKAIEDMFKSVDFNKESDLSG